MNNPKAIIIKQKKKLRVGQAVFNKKLGIYEWQIREGGRIVHRESVEEGRERVAQEVKAKSPDWKPRTVSYDEQGNLVQPKPRID